MINGRYTFKNTSIGTAMDNPRFAAVLCSPEQTGAQVELQYEEIGSDLIMTFQKELGVLPNTTRQPRHTLPALLTEERCLKELQAAQERKKALYKPRVQIHEPIRTEAMAEAKADVEYWTEMLKLSRLRKKDNPIAA